MPYTKRTKLYGVGGSVGFTVGRRLVPGVGTKVVGEGDGDGVIGFVGFMDGSALGC